jgi:hypothetical protein
VNAAYLALTVSEDRPGGKGGNTPVFNWHHPDENRHHAARRNAKYGKGRPGGGGLPDKRQLFADRLSLS